MMYLFCDKYITFYVIKSYMHIQNSAWEICGKIVVVLI